MDKKKGCWVENEDEYITAIVAESLYEAKKIFRAEYGLDLDEIALKKIKGNFDNLPIGIMDSLEALRRGIYGYIEEYECPICHHGKEIYSRDGKIGCTDCLDKLNKAPIPPAPVVGQSPTHREAKLPDKGAGILGD